jgi:uncharacterized protein (UPF0212 family)
MVKCPICKNEINSVIVVWKKEAFDTAYIKDEKLEIFYDPDNETDWDISRYECPECSATLPFSNDEDVEKFLRGEKEVNKNA